MDIPVWSQDGRAGRWTDGFRRILWRRTLAPAKVCASGAARAQAAGMEKGLKFSGVIMRVVANADDSAVSAETTFLFEQGGDVFSARYRGGEIVDGYLIGRLTSEAQFLFRYVQADRGGNLDAGVSTGSVTTLPDGRLRLVEDYEWLTRPGRGQNVLEEISRDALP